MSGTGAPSTGPEVVGANMVAEHGPDGPAMMQPDGIRGDTTHARGIPVPGGEGPPGIGANPDDANPAGPALSPELAAIAATLETLSNRIMMLEGSPGRGGTVAGIQSETTAQGPDEKRVRMIERKAFQKLEAYNGNAAQFDTWSYKLRGFLCTEPGFRPLLEWVERIATMEEDDAGQRPLTMLGVRCPSPGMDPWLPGTDGSVFQDEIPESLGKLFLKPGSPLITKWSELEWLGDNLYQVLQSLLEGSHMTTILKNLDPVQPYPARGIEAWFKLVRQCKGNTGPRLMRLVREIFAPVRIKSLEQLGGAVEAWE